VYTEKEPQNAIVLHPNDTELIVGDQSGNIRVYDISQEGSNKCRMIKVGMGFGI
jgi:uncharacterized protein involved in type VI secretion and phage assembly